MSLPNSPSLFRALFASLVLIVTLPAQPVERNYSPTDETSEVLVKYKTAMDAKNYTEANALLDGLLKKVPADSYDAALVDQYRLQIYMQQGDFAKAIQPMERSLALSESKTPTYFNENTTRELYYYLVQLYFQEAAQTKNASLAASYFDKAEKSMEHWLKLTPQTNADAQLIYSQLLYSKAMVNPDKPDLTLLKRALEQVEIGLHLATRPKDTFYVLKLVCLQQLDRNAEAAELLELLVHQKPNSSTYWQQLAAMYLNLSQETRAIITIERAQANGFMNAPKDQFNLVGIYFNIAQYEKAAELLETGLTTGKIDSDPKNWELLALSYQQLQRPLKGIEALKQGAKAFPDSGQLEFQIAQVYTSLDKPEMALPHIQAAIKKGNLTKPHQAHLSLAYAAYSLKKYDLALEAALKASEYPEGAKDGQNMVNALKGLIADREAKKNKS
jgi:tetratricopeptide (TPR) repeat protein